MTRRKKTFGRAPTLRSQVDDWAKMARRHRAFVAVATPFHWAATFVGWCLRLVEWVFSFPLVVAAIAVTGVVAGFWASLYTDDIKKNLPTSHPFDLAEYVRQPGTARFFWVLLLIFAVGFVAQQWAQTQGTRRAQRDLIAQSDELQEMIRNLRSLPPHGFLTTFQDLYEKAYPLGLLAFTEERKDILEDAIKQVLDCVARLASSFDREPGHTVYSANVMLLRDKAWLDACDDQTRASLEQQLLFSDDLPTPRTRHLDGVLTLSPSLAVTLDDHNRSGAAQTPAVALPIPAEATVSVGDKKTLARVLPGAPWAAVHLRYNSFNSIDELLVTFDEYCDFTERTRAQVTEYFEAMRGELKSFVSVPLEVEQKKDDIHSKASGAAQGGGPSADTTSGNTPSATGQDAQSGEGQKLQRVCVGVLNVHCSKEGILNNDGSRLFMPLLVPFLRVLVQLVGQYREVS